MSQGIYLNRAGVAITWVTEFENVFPQAVSSDPLYAGSGGFAKLSVSYKQGNVQPSWMYALRFQLDGTGTQDVDLYNLTGIWQESMYFYSVNDLSLRIIDKEAGQWIVSRPGPTLGWTAWLPAGAQEVVQNEGHWQGGTDPTGVNQTGWPVTATNRSLRIANGDVSEKMVDLLVIGQAASNSGMLLSGNTAFLLSDGTQLLQAGYEV